MPLSLHILTPYTGLQSHAGSGSGGYLVTTFRRAAAELHGTLHAEIVFKSKRNPEFREVTLTVGGEDVLRFAAAYGFKSIQTVMRQMKRNKCPYHFIEIMACPKGCTNGGAQLRADVTEGEAAPLAATGLLEVSLFCGLQLLDKCEFGSMF